MNKSTGNPGSPVSNIADTQEFTDFTCLKPQINQWIWENIPGCWTLNMCEELACLIINNIEDINKRNVPVTK